MNVSKKLILKKKSTDNKKITQQAELMFTFNSNPDITKCLINSFCTNEVSNTNRNNKLGMVYCIYQGVTGYGF